MILDRKSAQDGETSGSRIGSGVALWRYPVKSMGAESLEQVDVSWHGLAGDRRWAFVRGGMERRGFPWLTIRERPDMGQYRPWFVEPGEPNASPTRVRTPAGRDFDVADPALAAELGHDARVIKQDRGVFERSEPRIVPVRLRRGGGEHVNLVDARCTEPSVRAVALISGRIGLLHLKAARFSG